MVEWQWLQFHQLSTFELYEILKLRQAVFVVEQNCIYQDIDGLDSVAWHLTGRYTHGVDKSPVQAYARVVYPGHKYSEPSLGRVLTINSGRGCGLGRRLVNEALVKIAAEYPGQSVRISAQCYLQDFYSGFGFSNASEPYKEDGMPHIEMIRTAAN